MIFTPKTSRSICYMFLASILLYCTPEQNFDTPSISTQEPEITGTSIDIQSLLGMLGQELEKEGENAKLIFEDTDNFISGYVVSSDRASNFFKELIIQNKKDNPTAGIRVLVDVNPLFTFYDFGRNVFIPLNGLSIGIENGVPTLGVLDGNAIAPIPSFQTENTIVRGSEIGEIIPLELSISDFSDQYLHLFIKINNLQFHKNFVQNDNVFSFASEPNDTFDGERIIEDCDTQRNTILSTSTFSDFKGLKIPQNRGSFQGILTKNFLGDRYNLVLNDPNGLLFDTEERCDPQVFECVQEHEGDQLIFEQDFSDFKTSDLGKEGWLNINQTQGKLKYKIGEFANNKYAQITGFRSNEGLYEVWLITPEIDLGTTNSEVLNFDVQAGFDNGNILEVFISSDFVDDISTANWSKLDVTVPRGPLNAFGDLFPSGAIGLDCVEGTVRIGFRYLGGDPKVTTRYHIDNIKITGN